MVDRYKTGVEGLDDLIGGGVLENSVTTVVGCSGAGKTTLGLQFLLEGLSNDQAALFISLEEKPKHIIKQAELIGWNIKKYRNETLFFIHLVGQNYTELVEEQLPQLINARVKSEKDLRIVIDSLTPLMWYQDEKLAQRELITKVFEPLAEVGTLLATVDGNLTENKHLSNEIFVPVYLSDNVFLLHYNPERNGPKRTLQILKIRGTDHSEEILPVYIKHKKGVTLK
ncbi:MAG: RAD55 family ATPase [Thermoplasmatota archaeon]